MTKAEKSAKWRAEHPGYDKRTADERREQKRAWREANRERVNATHRAYVAARPELKAEISERAAKWRAEHPERVTALWRDWAKENPERVREHRRNSQRRVKYGIEPADYDRMLAEQDGRCAICGTDKPSTFRGGRKTFAIDHCHGTKKLRGLLCLKCNSGIGHLGDSIERLESALRYLKKFL